MKILFQLQQDGDLHDLGIIDTEECEVVEEIDDGFADWIEDELSMPTTPDMDQTDELLRVYGGPFLIANPLSEEE